MILYTHSASPRLQYIIDFIGKELQTGPVKIISSAEEFNGSSDIKLNYSDNRISENELWFKPHGLLFETGIRTQNVECFETNGNKAFFRTEGDLPFDIFAASFYLLSRYEEYLPHSKDMYGRYAFENSLAHREKFLNLPLVNTWLKDFRSRLSTKFASSIDFGITATDYRLSFIPTYDIDIAWSYKHKGWWRNAGGLLRSLFTGQWSRLAERLSVLRGKVKDPFDSFGWLNKLHEEHQLKPYYFFLVPETRGRYDKNISPSTKAMQDLVRDHVIRYPIGVHPSWKSGDDVVLLKKEIETLTHLNGTRLFHPANIIYPLYLPDDIRLIDNVSGSTDGYGSVNGFRASVFRLFWYDLERNKQN